MIFFFKPDVAMIKHYWNTKIQQVSFAHFKPSRSKVKCCYCTESWLAEIIPISLLKQFDWFAKSTKVLLVSIAL